MSNPDIRRVLDATDIVRLVGESVRLSPKGREFVGLCPFHDDHDPSLTVVPAKGFFKCHACGAGGDAIGFLRLHQKMEFIEALRFLAERAGITLTPLPSRRRSLGDSDAATSGAALAASELIDAHRIALSFYRTILRHQSHGAVARGLYTERGISEEMIERFELGYAPDRWDGLAATLQSRGIDLRPFEAAGLVMRRKSGDGFIDRFRHRLMFPIYDPFGRPVAFGARQIDPADEPKYLNSHEHARFHKSQMLFGLHLARPAIQKSGAAIVVEGYTDVIACHQAGVSNAVATLGTALTREHAANLRRLADRVILVFDGDAAGQKAADRATEIFFRSGVDIAIAVIPDDEDPAELLAHPDGAARFNEVIAAARDSLDFLFDSLRASLVDGAGVSGRQRLIESFLARLESHGFHQMTPLRRDLTLARLSVLLGLSAQTILESIPRTAAVRPVTSAPGASASPAAAKISTEPDPDRAAQEGVLAFLLYSPRLLDSLGTDGRPIVRAIQAEWFASEDLRAVFEALASAPPDERDSKSILAALSERDLGSLTADLLAQAHRLLGGDEGQAISRLPVYLRRLEYLVQHRSLPTLIENDRDAFHRIEALRDLSKLHSASSLKSREGVDSHG